ncbi:pleckstrin homology domain-containing family f member 2-related [Anaeramoeba flamelloides]|uniref:Pleckstrin homology domain-containing family f member 2-related n=1 Tax=Anaeramoeba flamelloides TaxID=1746091 RepID=A0ABQ8XF23_9EUKA|nr:pleckstrin homology domain-containing family f member 2-related [Anaeramoeba flamelloides]
MLAGNTTDHESDTSDCYEENNFTSSPTNRLESMTILLRIERNYASNLYFFEEYFQEINQKEKSLKFLEPLFNLIKEICQDSCEFVHNLEFKLLSWSNDLEMGDLFSLCKNHFKKYIDFFNVYNPISNKISENPQVEDFKQLLIKEMGLTFEQLVKSPVGHLSLQKEIISEYKHFSLHLKKETKLIEQFLLTIEETVNTIKSKSLENPQEIQDLKILELIEKKFVGKVKFTQKGRRLILKGSLTKMSKRRNQKRYMFLCNNILIVSSPHPVRKNKLTLRRIINLEETKFEDIPDTEKFQNAFAIKTVGKSFSVYAEDSKTKKKWIFHLNELINNIKKKKGIIEEEVNEAPLWQRDSDTKNCMICNNKFNVRRRRHHCRNCGKVICNTCSKFKLLLVHINSTKTVRCCKICHSELA